MIIVRFKGPAGNLVLYTNFFQLENQPNWGLYQYCVRFEPELQSKRLRLALIRNFDDVFGNSKAYDGGGTLFTSLKIEQTLKRLVKTRNGENVEITIELVKSISPLTERKASASNPDQTDQEEYGSISFEYYRILNIVLKRSLMRFSLLHVSSFHFSLNILDALNTVVLKNSASSELTLTLEIHEKLDI